MSALALMMSACVESNINPDDVIVVRGKVLDEAGQPLASLSVVLERGGNGPVPQSLDFESFMNGKTDATETYAFELRGSDTAKMNLARYFRVRPELDAAKGLVAVHFLIQVTDVAVPDMRQWSGSLTATAGTDGVKLGFVPLAEWDQPLSGALTVTNADGQVIWDSRDESPLLSALDRVIPAIALEDFTGLSARVEVSHEQKGSGTRFHIEHLSAPVALPAVSRVPISRGAQCHVKPALAEAGGCRFTDGQLSTFGPIEQLTVALGAPRQFEAVVLRGLALPPSGDCADCGNGELVVEGSTDGVLFLPAAATVGSTTYSGRVEVSPRPGLPPFTHVRLRAVSSDAAKAYRMRTLGELSVFE